MRNRTGRTGRRWSVFVVGAVLIVAAAGGAGWWLTRSDRSTGGEVPVAVAADWGLVTLDVAATGTVRAATTRSLSFTVDGTVQSMAVRAGTHVAAGDVLATIDSVDAAAAVSAAQSTLDDAENQLATAKAGAGAAVAPGPVATATMAPPPSAAAALEAGSAEGGGAEGGGAEGGSAEGGSAEGGGAEGGGAEGGAAEGGAAADAAPGGSVNDGTDAIFTAQERVNRAAAALKEAQLELAGTTIKAPIAGTVMSVAGQVGGPVAKGATFITLADTNTMQVEADFPEADAGALAAGQSATVTLADRVGEEFPAKVVQVDPAGTSDGTLVTYGVLLSFTEAPRDLLVGQTAAVTVRIGEVGSALRVPSTAVHDVANGSGTVLVGSGSAAVRRTVRVGLRGDRFTQIASGISAGEMVIRSW